MEAAGLAERVAIGSDVYGALKMLIDVEGLPSLTDALLNAGLPDNDVAGIIGSNAVRLRRRSLPN